MRVLIIEDEEVLARSLAAKLREIRPDIEIVGHTTSIQESISFLGIHKNIDIVFADIKIDDGLSFAIFDKLDIDAMIVFTTAYDEYALKAFSYNCADYLLKPISKEALEKTILRCEKRLPHITPAQIKELSRDVITGNVSFRKRLFFDQGKDLLIVSVDELCYVYTEKGNTRAYLKNGLWGSTDKTLLDLSAELDPGQFLRVNRQAIVNINCVERISPGAGRDYVLSLKAPYQKVQLIITPERKKALLILLDN
jgi:DNA-binding LytR/AlgR family response regulator